MGARHARVGMIRFALESRRVDPRESRGRRGKAESVERRGSSSSKLLAPRAMFKGAASAETKRVLGIAEWRIYQGKTQYVVTGYSAAGKAVKGVSIAFTGATESSKALLHARLLDGSHFSAPRSGEPAKGLRDSERE